MTINESEYTVNPAMVLTGPPRPQSLVTGTAPRRGRDVPSRMDTQPLRDAENVADTSAPSSAVARMMQLIVRNTSLAEVVRFSGAGLIVFALSLFLMQGVDATNDLQRFHLLLIQTGLLGVAGFAVGYVLKEPRGARVFFSLGLVSIPANLAVLGAMIYSLVNAGELTTQYPEYANWQASSLSEIAMATATGAVVLVPMALFAFSVFARQSRSWLTAGYLLSCAALLIPVRSTLLVTVLAGLLVMGLLFLIRHKRSSMNVVLTGEERFVQLMLFIPPVLMLVRSAMLYASEFNMLVTLSGVVYLVLRYCSKQGQKPSWLTSSLHLFTALSAICLAAQLSFMVAINGLFAGVNLSFCLISGVLLLDLSRVVSSRAVRRWMHSAWALLCLVAFFGNHVFSVGASSVMVTLLVCAMMIASGVLFKSRLVLALGVLALVGNVMLQGSSVLYLLLNSSWISLAVAGAAIVVAGSLIERYGVACKFGVQAWWVSSGSQREREEPVSELVVADVITTLDDDQKQGLAA